MDELVVIQRATEEDFNELVAMHYALSVFHAQQMHEVLPTPEYSRRIVHSMYADEAARIWIMKPREELNDVVGFCTVEVAPRSKQAHIHHIYLLEDYRGRGNGKALMQAAINELRQEGITQVDIGVYAWNRDAHHFYDAMGFAISHYTMGLDITQQEMTLNAGTDTQSEQG